MNTIEAANAATNKTTTIELDAEIVSKIRASLRAIRSNETIEEFVNSSLADMLSQNGGFFETLIRPQDESRRGEIETRLGRIRNLDKRLVRPEPMPCNAIVYTYHMARLAAIAETAGAPVTATLNSLLAGAMDQVESGNLSIKPNAPSENATCTQLAAEGGVA